MSAVAGLAAWVLTAATPAPGPVGNLDDNPTGGGTPGLAGFLFTFVLALVVIGLAFSLVRGMRRMERNSARLRTPDETAAPGGAAGASAVAPTGGPAEPTDAPTDGPTAAPAAEPTGRRTPPTEG